MKFKGGGVLALLGVIVLISFMVAGAVYFGYAVIDKVERDGKVNIPTGTSLQQQSAILSDNGFITDSSDYQMYANMMSNNRVYPGQFKLKKGMSYKELMNVLNRGLQTPVKMRFNASTRIENIARQISKQLEPDSAAIMQSIESDSVQKSYKLDSLSISTMFIPNTYEFYWNTSLENLLSRIHKEYERFWQTRDEKREILKMSRLEVMTLASIVWGETKYSPEMSTVAGVYINRLLKGMPLQADPTIIFAHQNWDIRRVLRAHLLIDSPYNTYKNKGLPPGPINIPSISAIDAVLNYKKTNYIFFCASENLDGTHNFAETYSDHLKHAGRYSQKLNELGIK